MTITRTKATRDLVYSLVLPEGTFKVSDLTTQSGRTSRELAAAVQVMHNLGWVRKVKQEKDGRGKRVWIWQKVPMSKYAASRRRW